MGHAPGAASPVPAPRQRHFSPSFQCLAGSRGARCRNAEVHFFHAGDAGAREKDLCFQFNTRRVRRMDFLSSAAATPIFLHASKNPLLRTNVRLHGFHEYFGCGAQHCVERSHPSFSSPLPSVSLRAVLGDAG
jgi:hypothetical protein